jgi:predicted adenine nucleotide alpha hydrolase (AANH) superfamily ATPase
MPTISKPPYFKAFDAAHKAFIAALEKVKNPDPEYNMGSTKMFDDVPDIIKDLDAAFEQKDQKKKIKDMTTAWKLYEHNYKGIVDSLHHTDKEGFYIKKEKAALSAVFSGIFTEYKKYIPRG